jgi:hypothetical protein
MAVLAIFLLFAGVGLTVFAPWAIIYGLTHDPKVPVVGWAFGIFGCLACIAFGIACLWAVWDS